MAENYSFVCESNGIRIDKFLTENIEDITRSAVQKIIDENNVTVNGKKVSKNYKCKAKVFTKMTADMEKQLGSPDVFILFTSTVSHKMVKCALDQAKNTVAALMR